MLTDLERIDHMIEVIVHLLQMIDGNHGKRIYAVGRKAVCCQICLDYAW